MMRKLALLLLIGIIFVFSREVSAQTKKLLVFKKKVAVVSGTIKGKETKEYFFKVRKDTDLEIFVDEAAERPRFVLYKPNGKLFYDEDSANQGNIFDMMDILPDAGIYKIAVSLPDESVAQNKPIKFTLRIVLR
jgi:hypothetical protein